MFSEAGPIRYGPAMVNSSLLESIVPSSVQTAPCALQSVVAGSVMVTSAEEFGLTCTSHLTFSSFSSRFALTISPHVAGVFAACC